MAIKEATDATFEELVLKNDKPTVVDFWATWCGPCKMVAPEMEKLAAKYAGAVDVVKVDVDANPGLSQTFQILSIPTIAFFRPGQQPKGVVGFDPWSSSSSSSACWSWPHRSPSDRTGLGPAPSASSDAPGPATRGVTHPCCGPEGGAPARFQAIVTQALTRSTICPSSDRGLNVTQPSPMADSVVSGVLWAAAAISGPSSTSSVSPWTTANTVWSRR